MKFKLILYVLAILSSINTSAQTLKVSFTTNVFNGCSPFVVNFTDNSTGNIANYLWDFGNGNTSNLKDPSTIYNSPGYFNVKLIITDSFGNKDSLININYIRVFTEPVANFNLDKVLKCINDTVSFLDSSLEGDTNIINWKWDFGDGTVIQQKNVKYAYKTANDYSIFLEVTDLNGCKSSKLKPNMLRILPEPVPDFTADINASCKLPTKVNFKDTTKNPSGYNLNYFWEFDTDDTSNHKDTSSKLKPSYTYTTSGLHTVKYQVSIGDVCVRYNEKKAFIDITIPKADFNLFDSVICFPNQPELINTSSDISSSTFLWDFGNGIKDSSTHPIITYKTPGTYNIKLIMKNKIGCLDSITKKITVKDSNNFNFDFNTIDTFTCKNFIISTFSYKATTGTSYQYWEFGDNTNSLQKEPTHTYSKKGVYTVTLTLKDIYGCSVKKSKSNYIKIHPLSAYFVVDIPKGCENLVVNFTNESLSSFPIKSYYWDFGNGKTSTLNSPSTVYKDTGTYYPKLIITDSMGCKDSFVYNKIVISKKPSSDFSYKRGADCATQNEITFYSLNPKKTKIDNYFWDVYGGGYIKGDSAKFNKYLTKGIYTISLVTENNGCFDTTIKIDTLIIVLDKAKILTTENPCVDDSVLFETVIAQTYVCKWYINAVYITDKVSFKKHLGIGKYNIILISYDSVAGCYDTATKDLEIRGPYKTGIETIYASKTFCANVSIRFIDTGRYNVLTKWIIEDGIKTEVYHYNNLFYTFVSEGVKKVKLISVNDLGCTDSAEMTFKTKMPKTIISISADTICKNGTVRLINHSNSTTSIKYRRWDIENGASLLNVGDTVDYTFTQFPLNANKGIRLYFRAEDDSGCVSLDSSYLLISNPVSNFTVLHTEMFCDSTEVYLKFDRTKSFTVRQPILEWHVNGAIRSSNTDSIRLVSTSDTTFNVNLIVKDSVKGCIDNPPVKPITLKVKVLEAKYISSDTIGLCPPLTVYFTNKSKVKHTSIATYRWYFGDNTNSIFEHPSKTFFVPGLFSISYVITDPQGCKDSIYNPSNILIKGPVATFTSDDKEGCLPFQVNFTIQSKNVKNYLWDLGNGIVTKTVNPTTIYNFPGVFNPYVIVEDSFGCKLTYYDDTLIYVYDNPKANFRYTGYCKNETFRFTNLSTTNNNEKLTYFWDFDDGDTSNIQHPSHVYKKTGDLNVNLKTTTDYGCSHDTVYKIHIGSLDAKSEITTNTLCYGSPFEIKDKSTADNKIERWIYNFGNGDYAHQQNPTYYYFKEGTYLTSLVIIDTFNCSDTFYNPTEINVYDSVMPKPLNMLRTTVNSDTETQFDWIIDTSNYILNYELYRWEDGVFNPYKKIINKNITSITEPFKTTREINYAYYIVSRSICYDSATIDSSKKHQTVVLKTTNGVNKITLDWNPYIGWNTVRSYYIYRKDFGTQVFTFIDSVAGDIRQYFDNSALCDFKYTYILRANELNGNGQFSNSNESDAMSLNPNIPNPPRVVRATVNTDNETQIDWDSYKNNVNRIKYYSIEKSLDGITYKFLQNTLDSSCCNAFIDNNVNTNKMSYYYRMTAHDICGISSSVSNIGKTILLDVHKNEEYIPILNWSDYIYWDKGIKNYEIEVKDFGGSFVKMFDFNNPTLQFADSFNQDYDLPLLCYKIKAISYDTFTSGIPVFSYSNPRCVVPRSTLFVPNAFTPNSDANNPKFKIVATFIKEYNIKIYNRWGQLVFESDNLYDSWDGTFNNNPAADNVFVFVIRALGFDNKIHNAKGNVTLLR